MKAIRVAVFTSIFASFSSAELQHPGIRISSSLAETIRNQVNSGDEPWKTPYERLKSDDAASADYTSSGPGPQVGHDTGNDTIEEWAYSWDADTRAMYMNALQYIITEDDAHAQKVAELVDSWVEVLSDFNESALSACIGGRDLINAAELVRYIRGSWPSGNDKFVAAQDLVSDLFVNSITMGVRPPEQPAIGGGQGFCKRIAALEFAIFTNNQTGFEAEVDLLKQPAKCEAEYGTTLPALFLPSTGQCAEAGRDQGHTSNDVAWFEEMAHVAANQGDNSLYEFESDDGENTPLLALAMEYYFKYNTGHNNLPEFDTEFGPCCCGTVKYSEISEDQRGNTYQAGEVGYNYYTSAGRELPFTKEWLSSKREDQDVVADRYLGYWTLVWGVQDL